MLDLCPDSPGRGYASAKITPYSGTRFREKRGEKRSVSVASGWEIRPIARPAHTQVYYTRRRQKEEEEEEEEEGRKPTFFFFSFSFFQICPFRLNKGYIIASIEKSRYSKGPAACFLAPFRFKQPEKKQRK